MFCSLSDAAVPQLAGNAADTDGQQEYHEKNQEQVDDVISPLHNHFEVQSYDFLLSFSIYSS